MVGNKFDENYVNSINLEGVMLSEDDFFYDFLNLLKLHSIKEKKVEKLFKIEKEGAKQKVVKMFDELSKSSVESFIPDDSFFKGGYYSQIELELAKKQNSIDAIQFNNIIFEEALYDIGLNGIGVSKSNKYLKMPDNLIGFNCSNSGVPYFGFVTNLDEKGHIAPLFLIIYKDIKGYFNIYAPKSGNFLKEEDNKLKAIRIKIKDFVSKSFDFNWHDIKKEIDLVLGEPITSISNNKVNNGYESLNDYLDILKTNYNIEIIYFLSNGKISHFNIVEQNNKYFTLEYNGKFKAKTKSCTINSEMLSYEFDKILNGVKDAKEIVKKLNDLIDYYV